MKSGVFSELRYKKNSPIISAEASNMGNAKYLDHFGMTSASQKTSLGALRAQSGPAAAPREVAHTPKSRKCSK